MPISKSLVAVTTLSLSLAFGTAAAWACAVHSKKTITAARLSTLQAWAGRRAPAQASADLPWGGSNDAKWTNEAVLANVFYEQFEAARARPKFKSTRLAIPAHLQTGEWNQYGDGQTNSRAYFGGTAWKQKRPPMVARLDKFTDGTEELVVSFHPSLNVTKWDKTRVEWQGQSWWTIRPQGWTDSFIVGFDKIEIIPVAEFMKGVAPEARKFSDGRSSQDPARISAQSVASNRSSLAVLLSGSIPGYNFPPYEVEHIHGRFPKDGGDRTASGGGWTWVSDRGAISPFKHLYSCFEARNRAKEAEFGVPSGAGWHRIGDPAETVFNTLENADIPVALGQPLEGFPVTALAYKQSGVIIADMTKPGEVFVTRHGQFHWYLIPTAQEACVEIWVHNCEPTTDNGWGFHCGT